MEGRKFTFKKKTTSNIKPPDVSHLLPLLENNANTINNPTTTIRTIKSPVSIPFKQSQITSPDLNVVKSNRPVYSQVCIKDPFETEPQVPKPKASAPKPAFKDTISGPRRPLTKQPVVTSTIKSPDMVTSSQMPGKQCSIDAFFSKSNIGSIDKGTPIKEKNPQSKSMGKPVAAVKPQVQSLISPTNASSVEKKSSLNQQEKPTATKKFSFNPKIKNGEQIKSSKNTSRSLEIQEEPVKALPTTSRLVEEDPEKCTRCQVFYDTSGNRSAPNRKITESCSHSICFTCFKMVMIQGSDCSSCGDCVICKQTCRDCNSENVPQITGEVTGGEETEHADTKCLRNTVIDDTFNGLDSKTGEGDSFPNQSCEDSDLLELDLSENNTGDCRSGPTTTGKQSPVLISTKNQMFETPAYDEEEEEDALCEIIALSPGYKNTRETAICLDDDDGSYGDDRGLTGMSKLQLNSGSSDHGNQQSNYYNQAKAQNRTESDVSLDLDGSEVLVEPEEESMMKPLAVNRVPAKKPQAVQAPPAVKNNKYQEYIDESLWNDEDEEEAVFSKPAAVVKAPVVPALDPKHAQLHQLGKRYNVSIKPLSEHEKINWLFKDIQDNSPMFHEQYEHTERMFLQFRECFGLFGFRQQQFEAINAAMLGQNVFVLMPTGGGKSLCYQLPASLCEGVTFVVSPLKSLIIDQVQKLNALHIKSAHLLGEDAANGGDTSNSAEVYSDLMRSEPTFKLIYVTPEKLNNSGKLCKIITRLYDQGKVARLVIDEAHCVSAWGHDFRKDYTQLGDLRQRVFPNAPVMLLTATATPRVRKDIIVQMGLFIKNNDGSATVASGGGAMSFGTRLDNKLATRNYFSVSAAKSNKECAFFMQSFNRENLQYKVEYKESTAKALEKIVTMIKSKYNNKCGIVYCISRNECETTAVFLSKNGVKALPYHAGMSDQKRADTQDAWMKGQRCKLVCATIAFGMGIDKADVRFVFHLGLPKSLEGYYQESGRAGRDGQFSTCILFYNNGDRTKWLGLMKREQEKTKGNYDVFKTHVDNLYRMSQYCDNRTDCRRAQILEYFGEIFDRNKCINSSMNTACDTCIQFSNSGFDVQDIYPKALCICKGVHQIGKTDATLLHFTEILKGSMNQKVVKDGHEKLEMHGLLKSYKKNDIERIMRQLISEGYLVEDVKINSYTDTVACYIKLGPKGQQLIRNRQPCVINFAFINDGSGPGKGKAASKYQALDATQSDSDDDEDGEDSADKSKVKATKPKKAGGEKKDLEKKCALDLKCKVMELCARQKHLNYQTVFNTEMLKKMIEIMPTTRESMMTVIHMTQHVYDRFNCEELLDIFKDYSARRQILIDAEVKKKQEEYEKKEAAKKALEAKAYLPTKSFSGNFKTIASVKNASSYGLLETNESSSIDYNFDYNPPAFSRSNYQENKKRSWGGAAKAGGAKKPRWGSTAASTDSPGGASAGGGWRGKKRNFKSKFSKFKKKS